MTAGEFAALQARMAQRAAAKRASDPTQAQTESAPGQSEAALHDEIIRWIAREGWLAFHSRMDLPTTRNKGEPDFTILAPEGRVFFVECKSRIGKLSPDQVAVAAFAERLGHRFIVVRSMEEFLEAVKKR